MKWREHFLYNKWLSIKDDSVFKEIIICTNLIFKDYWRICIKLDADERITLVR
jgi:hypothetical protein